MRTWALCIRRTLCRHVTIGTPMVIFCCLTFLPVFDDWYTVGTVKTAKKTIGVSIVTVLPRLYQQCTNSQKQSKQSKDGQNSKNDHWCTVVTMSTKTVPTVYQQCTKNSQKIVKTAKISLIIGVPIVRGLPRQYQQCTNR